MEEKKAKEAKLKKQQEEEEGQNEEEEKQKELMGPLALINEESVSGNFDTSSEPMFMKKLLK